MSKPEPACILYMEDDPGIARLVQKRLERDGYKVDIASDGAQGLSMYDTGTYDALVVDQNMPVYAGLDIIRMLTTGTLHPPIIMVTGAGSEKLAVEAMKLGASDYVVKDVAGGFVELLPLVIDQALQRQTMMRQKLAAEKALRESKSLLQSVIDHSPTVIYVKNLEGEYIVVNHQHASLLQRRRDDILGKTDYDLFPGRFAQGWYATDQEILSTGKALEIEEIVPLVDGFHTFLTNKFPIYDDQGIICAIAGVVTDITARKRTEETLRRSHAELEQRVQERTSDLALVNQTLENEITVRKQAQDELRQYQLLLQNILDYSPAAIFVKDIDGRYLLANRYAAAIAQLSPQDMLGKTDMDFIPAERAQKWRSDEQQVIDQGQTTEIEDELVFEDGTHTYLVVKFPMYDNTHTLYAVGGIATDITARKQAEASLLLQKQLLECQGEASLDGILVVDSDKQVIFFNQRFLDMWKLEQTDIFRLSPEERLQIASIHLINAEEFITQSLYLYDHPAERQRYELLFHDGRVFERYSAPLQGPQGEYYGRVWYDRDVTGMRRAQEALQSERNFVTAVIDTAGALVIVLDTQGRIVRFNRACQDVTGYTFEEINNRFFWEVLILPEEKDAVMDVFHALQAGQFPNTFENHVSTRDGPPRLIAWSNTVLLDDNQQVDHIVCTGIDITERQEAEAELKRRNDQLAALNVVAEAVNRSLELPAVLATLKTLFAETLHIAAGAIYLYNEADDCLVLSAVWNIPESMEAELRHLSVAQAHNRRVVWERVPVLLEDLPTEAASLHTMLAESYVPGCKYLGVPLVAQGEIQGVVDLFSAAPAMFRADQVGLFVLLGQQVGLAIHKARLFEELHANHEHLQTLSRQLIEVQEVERRTIASELHDEVGQILTGLNLSLEMIARLPVEQVHAHLDQARELVNELMDQVREMSLQLRPPMLDDLGLLPTLFWHFERYTAQTDIQVIFKHAGVEDSFGAEIDITAYRLIQEALTNVARYAHVNEVTVRLWSQGGMLGVQVVDQGSGFDPETALSRHASRGLAGMRERVMLLNGQLIIDSAPGAGCQLSVELPLP